MSYFLWITKFLLCKDTKSIQTLCQFTNMITIVFFDFLAARHLGFKEAPFPLSAAIFFTPVGHSKGFPLQSGLTTSFRFLRSSEVSKFQSSKVSSFTRELRNSGTQELRNSGTLQLCHSKTNKKSHQFYKLPCVTLKQIQNHENPVAGL